MSQSARRPGHERREAILAASMHLFARHGQHGVTTRMIADAAGVSEALLYRHFRGKEELFAELQRWCLDDTAPAAERLAAAGPSTDTLIRAVYFTADKIIRGCHEDYGGSLKRIMLQSLMGDGTFARGFLETNFACYLPQLTDCLEAAHRAGDIPHRPRRPSLRLWLMHHLAVMVSNTLLTDPPVVEHGVRLEVLIEEVALFSLRGLGLSEDALTRHFDAKALAAFTRSLVEPPPPSATAPDDAAPKKKGKQP